MGAQTRVQGGLKGGDPLALDGFGASTGDGRQRRLLDSGLDLQSLGSIARSVVHQPSFEEAAGVEDLSGNATFRERAAELAEELGRREPEVLEEAEAALRELSAALDPRAMEAWLRLSRWLTRGYTIREDPEGLARLRGLDRRHTLVFMISHRSYLDTFVMPQWLELAGLEPMYGIGGANLDFWPFGPLARRSGMIFIRRKVGDDPIYKFALREYLTQLVQTRTNLSWSLEGGRTRTGKLRPPRYGILRYLIHATRAAEGEEALLVPVSIVYDKLHEVGQLVAESRGADKEDEDFRWLARFARNQGGVDGNVYIDFAEPIPLNADLAELERAPGGGTHAVERVALQVCHRINSVTPVMPEALVTFALLAADRALTLDEVIRELEPLARYIAQRGYPVAGHVKLDDRSVVRQALDELDVLDGSGVATRFDEGSETVWGIGSEQELVAAFYRNTAIHFFVNRAIVELVSEQAIRREPSDLFQASWEEALRLRDLLKFEFFFPRRRDFSTEIQAELALVDEHWERRAEQNNHEYVRRWQAREWFERARPHVSHLVLRPFLEAYLIVAERLAAREPGESSFDDDQFLAECLAVGHQRRRQARLASAESVSLELFGTGLRLARHRKLLESGGEEVAERRREFLDEIRDVVQRVAAIGELARTGLVSAA